MPEAARTGRIPALTLARKLLKSTRPSDPARGLADARSTLWYYHPQWSEELSDEYRPEWLRRRLNAERRMLVRTWLRVRQGKSPHGGDDPIFEALRQSLDQYACAKALYMRATLQPLSLRNPGLATFRRYWIGGLRDFSPHVQRESDRYVLLDQLRVADYLLQSPKLSRIELRQGPFSFSEQEHGARTYIRGLKIWRIVEQKVLDHLEETGGTHPAFSGRSETAIRFGVHFKRSKVQLSADHPLSPSEDVLARAIRSRFRGTSVATSP